MTTPPSKLLDALVPGCVHTLRSADGKALGDITYADATRMARAGLIEGVGGGNGRIRYLRELNDAAVEQDAIEHLVTKDKAYRSRSQSLNAVTNLGSYLQELTTGKTWALKMCRKLDGARA